MSRPEADTLFVFNPLKTSNLTTFVSLGLIAGILLLAGCLHKQTVKTVPQTSPIDQLLATAESFEKQAQYLKAQEQCQRALEIDPRNSRARACKAHLDQRLRRLADQKVRRGLAMARKGHRNAANRMFLEALELWPAHEQALRQIARNHPLTRTPFILHKLKPGDNLSTLALKYYANSFYYPIIAEFNQIQHDSKVKAGERLRIPKIIGLPLHTHGETLKTMAPADRKVAAYRSQAMAYLKAGKFSQAIARLIKALHLDKDDLATRQQLASAFNGLGQQSMDQKEYAKARNYFLKGISIDSNCKPCQEGLSLYHRAIADKHMAEARRLLEADQFEAAVAEFEKARKLNGDDQTIDDIISRAHYQKAEQLCAVDDLDAARKNFELAAKFNPRRFNDRDYERQCRDAYLEIHYNRGIEYYQKGQSQAAIAEWEMVRMLNSDYKAVRYNLELARILMGTDDQQSARE